MIIKELSRDNYPDWWDFFDSRAFADNPEWKGCYCTAPFLPQLEEYTGKSRARKPYAKWLVENGKMKGYLVYEGDKVVGWCNVNWKSALPRHNDGSPENTGILFVACFLVQKEFRGKGVAKQLLERIVKDARDRGVRVIEAHPRRGSQSEYGNYHGPATLFESFGFQYEEVNGREVARKYL